MPAPDIEICILAGGLSRRMGRDKSEMEINGLTLLNAVRRAAEATHWPVSVIRKDAIKRCGPIGGLFTGLRQARARRVLFLPCDMPFLSLSFLKRFVRALRPEGKALFTEFEGVAGFPILMDRNCLAVVKRQIERGEFALHTLADEIGANRFQVPARVSNQIWNINTPEEFAAAQANPRSPPRPHRRQSTPPPVLDVVQLKIRRGTTHILAGIDWTVRSSEHWTILGANGSGKTSLLSALTGYLPPTSGRMQVFGREYGRTDWREIKLQVGLVSSSIRQMIAESEPALETVASGKYAMIDYWGKLSAADRAAARKVLRQVECLPLEERPWAYLSQGERQRVLIGRALMARPRLLVLDEPCAGLDPAAREHFLQFINRLGTQPAAPTLVLVTHHVEEVMPVFTHALLLKEGRVLASGVKKNVLNSKNLSEAFDAAIRMRARGGRYSLDVQTHAQTAFGTSACGP